MSVGFVSLKANQDVVIFLVLTVTEVFSCAVTTRRHGVCAYDAHK